MEPLRVLVIDDDAHVRRLLHDVITDEGHVCIEAETGEQALQLIRTGQADLAVVDLELPDVHGLELLRHIKAVSRDIQAVILTAHGSIPAAVQAMRLGADDFWEKPFDVATVRKHLSTSDRIFRARRISAGSNAHDLPLVKRLLTGVTPAMQQLRRQALELANTSTTLLLQGEYGTGKEQFARVVHYCGARSERPFIPLDATSLSPHIAESELFGHIKGAFTGAEQSRQGILQAAGMGTVLIDEISEIPLALQARFLRVLQEHEVRPVGADKPVRINARIVAASNKDLAQCVKAGTFRADLFYRLNIITITMPTLRSRRDDVPLLAEVFRHKYIAERSDVTGISRAAVELMMAYDWPGNVRELENTILRAMVLGRCNEILPADLPPTLTQHNSTTCKREDNQPTDVSCNGNGGRLAMLEREAIAQALEETDGNRQEAAELLGISPATLYRRLREAE